MKKVIKIENLCCPNCSAKVEAGIKKLDGVNSCVVSFLAQKIILDINEEKLDEICEKIKEIAQDVEPNVELTF